MSEYLWDGEPVSHERFVQRALDPGASAVVEACGFDLRAEIGEREETPVLDAELETSLLEAPQQRVQALLERLEGQP